MANDIPKIAPFDNGINNRLNIISYKKTFVAEPSNEFELKRDENLESEMKSDKFKLHFGYVILNSYLMYIKNDKIEIIPEGVKNAKTEWVGDNTYNLTINKFLEEYETSNNLVDFTSNRDIELWLKTEKFNLSVVKFSIDLKKYCTICGFNNVESKIKKVGGKCVRGWIGIKLKDSDDDLSSLDV
jgi:hypothetical protein